MFGVGGLFMEKNVYVPEGGNEGGRDATPTSLSIFDFYGKRPFDLNLVMISSLATKCQHCKLVVFLFHYIKWLKKGHYNFKVLAF